MLRLRHARVLMYSHDTFGLGHLRRCRTIAHSLVEDFKGLNVLILSGSQIAGAFDFRARADFVKIPSVIKLYNGEYTSLDRHIDLSEILGMRQSIIRHTAETFQPDIMLVDKEPLGLRGEMLETLTYLKTRGTTLVLGLRDVMDAPELLRKEWKRKNVLRRIEELYDHIWVYGPRDFWDPLTGLNVSARIKSRMDFLGFLRRSAPVEGNDHNRPDRPYLLVTAGGGGDGGELMRQVIAAYRSAEPPPLSALLVLGPLMPAEERHAILRDSRNLPMLSAIEFDNRIESLIAGARGVVSMGGYNTFCEILSFDKPGLLVPRVRPREEQLIRARRASELGLVRMLMPEEAADPARLAAALTALPSQPPPSRAGNELMLDGLESIRGFITRWAETNEAAPLLTAIRGGL